MTHITYYDLNVIIVYLFVITIAIANKTETNIELLCTN